MVFRRLRTGSCYHIRLTMLQSERKIKRLYMRRLLSKTLTRQQNLILSVNGWSQRICKLELIINSTINNNNLEATTFKLINTVLKIAQYTDFIQLNSNFSKLNPKFKELTDVEGKLTQGRLY